MCQNCKPFVLSLFSTVLPLRGDKPARLGCAAYDFNAGQDKLPAASLLIDLSFQIEIKKRTQDARSFMMPPHKITPFFLLEALADPRGLPLPSRGKSFVKDRSPPGALLDLRVSSTVHGAQFPELHSFMMSESIQRCLSPPFSSPGP